MIPDGFKQYKNSKYYINREGKIWSIFRNSQGRMMKPGNVKGYRQLRLSIDGKNSGYYVHRLVAETFIENPLELNYVNHRNNIKHDNRVENLEWCTPQENMEHMVKQDRQSKGQHRPSAFLSNEQILEIRRLYATTKISTRKLALQFNISYNAIHKIVTRQTWRHI